MNTSLKANVIQLQTKITVAAPHIVATPEILELVQWANVHKQQLELAKKTYDEAAAILKLFMGDNELLISEDGRQLATYKQQADRLELDKEALRLNYADIYAVCLESKSGNRPFILK